MGKIVRAAIHPGIGMARVGDSEEYYVGPQVTAPTPRGDGAYHDANGALKREAAEFRIYGYDADGNVVAELTDGKQGAEISWTVHMASQKADWFRFAAAMDVPEMATEKMTRRNTVANVPNRSQLIIDPGPGVLTGPNQDADLTGSFTFDGKTDQVMIGQMKTDDTGRLIMLGGLGKSASPNGSPLVSSDDWFGNSEGWYDDIGDGPVDATVTLDGEEIPVEGAWIVSAPPSWAPDLVSWRTMDDMMRDIWAGAGWIELPMNPSFKDQILPLLQRMSQLQWVNQGFAAMFGSDGPMNFEDPVLLNKICKIHGGRARDAYKELRQTLVNAFRIPYDAGQSFLPGQPPGTDGWSAAEWPWIYGDMFGTSDTVIPRDFLATWPQALDWLQKWADGDFIADFDPTDPCPTCLDDVALADQPSMLDRAAMHFCVADAFHPGIEMTWPMRHITLYSRPYRIKRRPAGADEPDYGPVLTQEIALSQDGPLYGQGPGTISRWMLVPWQVDTAGCRSGYETNYDPALPTFWPARVPNQVLSQEEYEKVMDDKLTVEDRVVAFQQRRSWYYPLTGKGMALFHEMIRDFGKMGVVEKRPGPKAGTVPGVPEEIWVEILPKSATKLLTEAAEKMTMLLGTATSPADKQAQELGWDSDDQRRFFARARFPAANRLQGK